MDLPGVSIFVFVAFIRSFRSGQSKKETTYGDLVAARDRA